MSALLEATVGGSGAVVLLAHAITAYKELRGNLLLRERRQKIRKVEKLLDQIGASQTTLKPVFENLHIQEAALTAEIEHDPPKAPGV